MTEKIIKFNAKNKKKSSVYLKYDFYLFGGRRKKKGLNFG